MRYDAFAARIFYLVGRAGGQKQHVSGFGDQMLVANIKSSRTAQAEGERGIWARFDMKSALFMRKIINGQNLKGKAWVIVDHRIITSHSL